MDGLAEDESCWFRPPKSVQEEDLRKLAPSHINDLVKIKPLNSRYGLRSNDGILLSHPNFKTLTTLGDHAFVASAPKLWNDLPSDIRMAKSVDTFKNLLKTHLFSKAFYS